MKLSNKYFEISKILKNDKGAKLQYKMDVNDNLFIQTISKKETLNAQYHPNEHQNDDVNSMIALDPAIVIFKGFELDVAQTRTLKIINTASTAQRLNILPPISDDFEFTFSKKAKLAPGIAQSINIKFIAREFRIYETSIRIQTSSGCISVPIKSYPTMSYKKEETFPTLISFGWQEINKSQILVRKLESTIDLPFEFQFKNLTNCPEIQIIPMSGIVPANGYTEISLKFLPIHADKYLFEGEVS